MIHTIHADSRQLLDFRSTKNREILFENDSLACRAYPRRQYWSGPHVKNTISSVLRLHALFIQHTSSYRVHPYFMCHKKLLCPMTVARLRTNDHEYYRRRRRSWHRTRCSNRSHVKGVSRTPREYRDYYYYYINVSKRARVLNSP